MNKEQRETVTLIIPSSLKLKIELMAILSEQNTYEIVEQALITFFQMQGYCDLAKLLQNFPPWQKKRVSFPIDRKLKLEIGKFCKVRSSTKTEVVLSALAMLCHMNGIDPLIDLRHRLKLALRDLNKESP